MLSFEQQEKSRKGTIRLVSLECKLARQAYICNNCLQEDKPGIIEVNSIMQQTSNPESNF